MSNDALAGRVKQLETDQRHLKKMLARLAEDIRSDREQAADLFLDQLGIIRDEIAGTTGKKLRAFPTATEVARVFGTDSRSTADALGEIEERLRTLKRVRPSDSSFFDDMISRLAGYRHSGA